MRRLALLLAVAAALPVVGCGGADADDAIATVDDLDIGAAEVAELYASTLLQTGLPDDDPRLRDEVLQSLVHKHLLVADAYDTGIRDTEAFAAARDDIEERVLVNRYAVEAVGDAMAVTDADLRRAFVQSQTTYQARHLYARSRERAQALRARLAAGETFEALAEETFVDERLRTTGGSLGAFAHDELDPALEDAAFELPIGEVSAPIRTAQGWSVLRVDARSANPLLTEDEFARKRARLRRYVTERKRTEARFLLAQRVQDELDVRFEPDAMARLAAMARGTGTALSDEALAAWRRTPLVRFDSDHLGDAWTVADVEAFGAAASEEQRAAIQDEASLEEFVRGLVVRDELVARARAAGLERDDAVRRVVAQRLEDWVFEHAARRVRASVAIPGDTLRAHFDAEPDRFRAPERVRAAEILVETRAQADRLRAELRRGADFGELARRHSLRPGAARADGDLGAVTRDQLGAAAGPVWRAAPGAVVGPIEVAGRYALVRRGETLPARAMTFDEARPDIARALDETFARRALTARLAQLRDRYAVTVDRQALAAVRIFPDAPGRPAPAASRTDRS